MPAPEALLQQLTQRLASSGGAVVGFSGGVDSALLAKAAHDALGPQALAVTVDSPSLARRELDDARALAQELRLRWEVAQAHEMANPLYVANPGNRCFFCREEMSAVLGQVARRAGLPRVAMGVNVSDLAEDRPGHAAMQRAGVWWPLVEVGASKEDVRAMARAAGLRVADKPAMACLSSRVPHGEPITLAKLRRIEAAEDWLRDRGFGVVRVRAQGEGARVEVAPAEVPRLEALAAEAESALRAFGFASMAVDPQGYRPGGADAPAVLRL
jgi:uncharacterized protein